MSIEVSDSKLYYSMGEVADRYQVNHSLIRYWEKEFDIINPKKNKKGNRLFTKKDLDAFELIYDLVKRKGYTLDGAKLEIKERKSGKLDRRQLVDKLKDIRAFLLELESGLD
ncbi:MAG: MerR family transcriptional regulator [Vicingaceae bacterium]